jgi:hypothetical protein
MISRYDFRPTWRIRHVTARWPRSESACTSKKSGDPEIPACLGQAGIDPQKTRCTESEAGSRQSLMLGGLRAVEKMIAGGATDASGFLLLPSSACHHGETSNPSAPRIMKTQPLRISHRRRSYFARRGFVLSVIAMLEACRPLRSSRQRRRPFFISISGEDHDR